MMLASLLLVSGTWTWDASANADGYAFCWSNDPTYWTLANCHDTGPATSYLPPPAMNRLWGFDQPDGAFKKRGTCIAFFQIVAYNAAGYSITTEFVNAPPLPSPYTMPPVLP